MTDRDRADEDVPDLDVDDVPDGEPGGEDGRVLAPDELDITDSDHVSQIDENRFVVSPDPIFPDSEDDAGSSRERTGSTEGDGRTDAAEHTDENQGSATEPTEADSSSADSSTEAGSASSPSPERGEGPIDVNSARLRLARELASADRRYGLEIVATFDDVVTTRRSTSNDVVATFEGFLQWYARQITDEVPPDEALGVLLLEASIPITYPTANIGEFIKNHDLDPDDSIADLLYAIEADSRRD